MDLSDNTSLLGRLLTVKEVSLLLHLHPNTVRLWSDRGLIPTYRIGPRGDRRFPERDVLRLLGADEGPGKALREMAMEYLSAEAKCAAS